MQRQVAGLAVGVICVMGGLIAVAAESAAKTGKPCVAISGADSHVTVPRCLRITSADQWERVWQQHKGVKPTDSYDSFYDPLTLPKVDFNAYMVIAVFQGSTENCAGLQAVSMTEEDRRILLRFSTNAYQTGASTPDRGVHKVTPYGFFVVPRSAKAMVIQQQIPRSEPPKWKERATLPEMQQTKE